MKIKPLKDKVLVEYLEGKDFNTTTKSGLEIQDKSKVKLNYRAKVINVGDEVTFVNEGDIIIFKWHENEDFDHDGKKYSLIPENKVLCIVN